MAQPGTSSIINLSAEPLLSPPARDQARRNFYHIVDHFDTQGGTVGGGDGGNRSNIGGGGPQYTRPLLIRLTYDFSLSPLSQDNFLRAFFRSLELSIDEDIGSELDEQVRTRFFGFADYLINNFFLPIKATTRQTPQPSPAFHSAVQRIQGGGEFAGTPDRLSALRGACLIRDRHRCVVSRSFDWVEADRRFRRDAGNARDDDGALLEPTPLDHLEVAHILPHSLTKLGKDSELDPSKQAALAILNMFDDGVTHLIEGTDIDRPRNALTLTLAMHRWFGDFKIFFEPVPAAPEPHTYSIKGLGYPALFKNLVPITRTLYLTDNRTIEPPSPRLLAIHRAIAHILHLSAAGEYIDKILDDMEGTRGQGVEADGSTDLGRLVHLGLWLDGAVGAC
ncbi:hypothetical protein C8A00DRAFT_42457 [Chaetomidium leptoderma]|uniref:HNH nuclease domain-containing protein n=1 Tax=Chaetomidium leptoderma TaxID=669021 RepID=A0AAN6VPD2_9PEZI|nr:hypothetical protein C8A00DRAFT_42457 [Chaetomidium leptoderma]